MPYVARHVESDKLDFAARANPNGEYQCFMCDESVSYVKSHTRGENDDPVTSHFRYNDCGHAGKQEVSEHGGGENPKHRRRKLAALHEATTRFPNADSKVEYYIGIKRADAAIVFDQPHEKYGKGLAIEYQNKHEDKDIEGTQEYFAHHEFTTVWLHDSEFDMSGNIPDIDLFGGSVYSVWPKGVPKVSEWHNSLFYQKHKYFTVVNQTTAKVPANFIQHWFVPTTAHYWNATRKWDARFRDNKGYKSQRYIAQALAESPTKHRTANPKIILDWVWPTKKDYWQDQTVDWQHRFSGTTPYLPLQNNATTLEVELPISKWIQQPPEAILNELRRAYELGVAKMINNDKIPVQCTNCSNRRILLGTAPNHSWKCPNCNTWNAIKTTANGFNENVVAGKIGELEQ